MAKYNILEYRTREERIVRESFHGTDLLKEEFQALCKDPNVLSVRWLTEEVVLASTRAPKASLQDLRFLAVREAFDKLQAQHEFLLSETGPTNGQMRTLWLEAYFLGKGLDRPGNGEHSLWRLWNRLLVNYREKQTELLINLYHQKEAEENEGVIHFPGEYPEPVPS